MEILQGVLQAVTTLVLGMSACYFFGMVWLGLRASKAARAPLNAQASIAYLHPDAPLEEFGADITALDRFHRYYLIPCLNEEVVIGTTVSYLTESGGTIIVIDDASDDATSQVAAAASSGDVVVVRRELPNARVGKGPALNAGFATLLAMVRHRQEDPSSVIVCVMDADGRLSYGALSAVLPLFDDERVGGVQLAVRIRNRINWVTKFQNFQFWTMSAMTQFGRIRTGTVSLGGNGQFTRLSALLEIGEQPWNASLTEDLDLSVSMVTRGWRCTTTPHASVDQQGVEKLRPLLKQRTRWYQGHMMAGARIPDIWRGEKISHTSAIEAILYLLVPWILDLPWSILYHLALIRFAIHADQSGSFSGSPGSAALGGFVLYVVAFYPALITALLCYRRDPGVGIVGSIVLGHSFVLMNYLSWTCCWRALVRMIRGQNGWAKTDRTVESATTAPEPVERVAA
jgi:cellulose synthase/poly-beta-1,6-N-acetylglucosamine synthase-like glycosyltransferase